MAPFEQALCRLLVQNTRPAGVTLWNVVEEVLYRSLIIVDHVTLQNDNQVDFHRPTKRPRMSSYLFDRALGSITPRTFAITYTTHLVHALQLAPNVQFDGRNEQQNSQQGIWGHRDGVNSVVADHFEGRL